MMSWPSRTSTDLHRARNIYAPARWTEDPLPVSQVPKDLGVHPRRSKGPDAQVPDGQPYYWCRSCNRVVANANRPFCDMHREPRRRFVRRLSDARTVPVPRETVERLLDLTRILNSGRRQFNDAPNGDAQAQVWALIEQAIRRTAVTVRVLGQVQPQVRTDDIDDTDYRFG